jgi:hypothetical protein
MVCAMGRHGVERVPAGDYLTAALEIGRGDMRIRVIEGSHVARRSRWHGR